MNNTDIQKVISEAKAELKLLEKEHEIIVKQHLAKVSALKSKIYAFESVLVLTK